MLSPEFPQDGSSPAQRVFALGVAIVGLIVFALVLALTEQVRLFSLPL